MRERLCLLALFFILSMGPALSALGPGQSPATMPATTQAGQAEDEVWSPEQDGIGDLVGATLVKAPGPKRALKIDGHRYSPEEFARYVKYNVAPALNQRNHWRPRFIVLHNTWKPTLTQLPDGFNERHMQGLANYYGLKMGWRAGPAAFVDQNGIWVFSGFDRPGVHSPSWNRISWGIEQLGDFERELYDSGGGGKVRENTVAALAILCIASKLDISTLKLHKEDPKTTHACPGKLCEKSRVIEEVKREIGKWRAQWQRL